MCSERGCVFPAIMHGLCLHHLRIWGFVQPVRVHPHPDTVRCQCGKEYGHRGRCFGAAGHRAKKREERVLF